MINKIKNEIFQCYLVYKFLKNIIIKSVLVFTVDHKNI